MVQIKDYFIKGKNRPKIKLKKKKGLVWHWTANVGKGANAKANANYFNNTSGYASTQYIVDSTEILRLMPDNEIAYHVGATSYTAMGAAIREAGYNPNYFLVGIEICVNQDGDYAKTELNAIDLGAHLMIANKWTIKDMYRHYDITGKACPKMYLSDKDWKEFLAKLDKRYKQLLKDPNTSINAALLNEIDDVVEVTTKGLAIRRGPDTTYEKVGEYALGEKVRVYDLTDHWYRTDKGWISALYTEEVDDDVQPAIILDDGKSRKFGKIVKCEALRIRKGPSTSYAVAGSYAGGLVVELFEHKNSWYRTSDGWISGYYVEELTVRKEVTLIDATDVYEDIRLTKKISTLPKGSKTILFGETSSYAAIKEGFIKPKTFK